MGIWNILVTRALFDVVEPLRDPPVSSDLGISRLELASRSPRGDFARSKSTDGAGEPFAGKSSTWDGFGSTTGTFPAATSGAGADAGTGTGTGASGVVLDLTLGADSTAEVKE